MKPTIKTNDYENTPTKHNHTTNYNNIYCSMLMYFFLVLNKISMTKTKFFIKNILSYFYI